jgi:hypothetical protein
MFLRSVLGKLAADRRGGVAAIVVVAFPVLIGGVAFAADTIQWTYIKRAIQRQADSAAIAGAFGLAQGSNVNEIATADIARNNNVTLTLAPVIENAPTAGPFVGNARAVRVALGTNVRLPFSGYLMRRDVLIPAEATAQVISIGQYCVLALETASVTGISMGGNGTVNLGCGMMSNSSGSNAVTGFGSSQITATPIAAVGGLRASENYAAGTELVPYSVPQFDPFGSIPNPTVTRGSNLGNVGSNQTATLSPGTYAGMDLKGNVTLSPGTYYIDGGSFSVGSQAVVTGTGVTIVLSSRNASSQPASIATLNINGGASVNLTAPVAGSGTYAGMLFFQDKRAPNVNQTNKINGNSTSKLQGAIYFPSQEIEFTGTTGMDIKCIQLVGRRVKFNGNSTVTNVCPPNSGASAFTGTRVKLVA